MPTLHSKVNTDARPLAAAASRQVTSNASERRGALCRQRPYVKNSQDTYKLYEMGD